MIRQAHNQVEIEGILSEINLDYKSYKDSQILPIFALQ